MTARMKSPLLPSILICLAVSPGALRAQSSTDNRGQVSVTRPPDGTPVLSDRAKKQLREKLESAAATPLQPADVDGAPLEITNPKAQSIRIEGNYDAPPGPVAIINDYVIRLRFRLFNRSNRFITGAIVELTNEQDNNTFFLYYGQEEIEPGKNNKFDIPFMCVTGDPAHLSVQLVGARFGDGSTWGSFPFPQRHRSSALPKSSATMPAPEPQVDLKPRALNRPQPRYTEDARRNHVVGSVVMRLLVGSDGAVRQVNVIKSLPDGLTEAAMRAAYDLKFEAAKKNGEPVEYWIPVVIEFNLR